MEQLLMFAVMGVAMYFLLIKPQQKRAKEAQNMLNNLTKGTKVVTIGGLHGIIEEINETTVVLDCEGIYLTFERRAIGRVENNVPAVEPVAQDMLEDSESPKESQETPATEEVVVEDIVSNVE